MFVTLTGEPQWPFASPRILINSGQSLVMSESLGSFFFFTQFSPSSKWLQGPWGRLGGRSMVHSDNFVQEPSSRGLASSSARGPDLWLGLGLETDEKPQLFKAMIELRF